MISATPWPEQRARDWHARVGWLAGVNFIPSTAVNQLEMWQAETFDLQTIRRELGWAAGLGFNSVRVFLHDLLWQIDARGFLERIDRFLEVAHGYGIGAMFVFFDGVWNPHPRPGAQPDPRPHVHNAGWVQSPGAAILAARDRHDELKLYVQEVLRRFAADPRVHAWDLFNEPDNPNPAYGAQELPNKAEMALALLERTFAWAREVNPIQPLTCGVWFGDWSAPDRLRPIERYSLDHSDVVSFHGYGRLNDCEELVRKLRHYRRPILCTEYMARTYGSTFDPVLGYCEKHDVGVYSWGLVAGRTQTIYPWDSWIETYDQEPPLWFHDILRSDGTPHDLAEVDYIRRVIGRHRSARAE